MKTRTAHIVFLFVFVGLVQSSLLAQDRIPRSDSKTSEQLDISEEIKLKTTSKKTYKEKKHRKIKPYEPLAPARAAFYSAILPGLGQAYTNNYWKIPLVYAAIGGGIYYYGYNNRLYNEARAIYKRRLAGFRDDRFIAINEITGTEVELISNDGLLNAQSNYRKDRELAILFTVIAYVLNILDANVAAHLQQYNINENLSMRPNMQLDQWYPQPHMGLKLQYHF